jgi:hypothetical protein
MDTTLIRDEIISASSLDLPGQQRFNMVKAAIGPASDPTTRSAPARFSLRRRLLSPMSSGHSTCTRPS